MPDDVPPSRSAVISTARRKLALTLEQIWLGYIAVGGDRPFLDLRSWFSGAAEMSDRDYDFVAQALNDNFTDRGLDHPVGYSADSLPSL